LKKKIYGSGTEAGVSLNRSGMGVGANLPGLENTALGEHSAKRRACRDPTPKSQGASSWGAYRLVHNHHELTESQRILD